MCYYNFRGVNRVNYFYIKYTGALLPDKQENGMRCAHWIGDQFMLSSIFNDEGEEFVTPSDPGSAHRVMSVSA